VWPGSRRRWWAGGGEIDSWNQDPCPFAWTKTADGVLQSLADYRAEITPPVDTEKSGELNLGTSGAGQ